MKKLLSSLAFIALFSLAFISCDDNTIDNLTGNMDITVDGENKSIPAAYFQFKGNQTIITAGSISITIKGKAAGDYTLGLGKTAAGLTSEILSEGLSTITSGSHLAYTHSLNIETSIYGTLTITEVSDKKITGSFSTTVTEISNLFDLDFNTILSILKGTESSTITGSFTAVSYTN